MFLSACRDLGHWRVRFKGSQASLPEIGLGQHIHVLETVRIGFRATSWIDERSASNALSNRETRKPKKDKAVAKPASPFGSAVKQAEAGLKPKSKG
ncbi:hypothetical protein [Mesorhizobium sp. M9A.F.Ca.ET.002.03.1.2]|uniref:hypothetical protein n=1 Tax=Mesorhizobium sp. M9A.F.Ca.ET.002.03.1.2 TaxID=2493668 RepID=UPI00167A723D|nr:hypothetical protein [Mesorhizobium sp. M9A.F.Ca.ET.002.03.1.2]